LVTFRRWKENRRRRCKASERTSTKDVSRSEKTFEPKYQCKWRVLRRWLTFVTQKNKFWIS
jgi:hypothetical protein